MLCRARFPVGLGLLICAVLWSGFSDVRMAWAKRPNVIFVLTDNHGAWTLGCYGNREIRTPNLDRLANQGTLFERAMSSNPVCSPTRATYLTGLMPSQHGVHSFLDNKYMVGPQAYYTLEEFETLPEILSSEGYRCGLTGKWHLGANLEPHDGFTTWATMPKGSTSHMYEDMVILDGKVVQTPKYMTELWTDLAIQFIEESQQSEAPFFLFLSYNGPYCLGPMLNREARNRHARYYADKPLFSFPRDTIHPWQYHNRAYHNNMTSIRRVAAEVSAIDDGVGEVLSALQRLDLSNDTLIVFAGDQGWMGGQNGFFGMGDHTRPVAAHDLMMQVPLIFSQPGRIPQQRLRHMVSNTDFLPSILEYLDLGHRVPDGPNQKLSGRSYAKALVGDAIEWKTEMYYEMEGCRSVRTENWKYVERRFPDGPGELYDIRVDPHERFNLFGHEDFAEVQSERAKQLHDWFDRWATPEFDVWKGGRSKAHRLLAPVGHPDYRPLRKSHRMSDASEGIGKSG